MTTAAGIKTTAAGIKRCMQCDTGRASVDRRCRWCHSLSCEECMPDGLKVCFHCNDFNADYQDLANRKFTVTDI